MVLITNNENNRVYYNVHRKKLSRSKQQHLSSQPVLLQHFTTKNTKSCGKGTSNLNSVVTNTSVERFNLPSLKGGRRAAYQLVIGEWRWLVASLMFTFARLQLGRLNNFLEVQPTLLNILQQLSRLLFPYAASCVKNANCDKGNIHLLIC